MFNRYMCFGFSSYSLKAAASYVNALQRFFHAQFPEAKLVLPSTLASCAFISVHKSLCYLLTAYDFCRLFLQEALKLANTEDLNKLTACGLVLLGQIFLHMGLTQEVPNLVNPALQLAQKIPEVNIQLWSTALLRGILCNTIIQLSVR